MRSCKTVSILLAILLSMTLFGQEKNFQTRFDSLYNKAMGSVSTDTGMSIRYLKTLLACGDELSMAQRAWLSYLEMRIRDAGKADLSKSGKTKFAAPDSLMLPDSLQYYACRYLERSMPDQAIAMLMQAIKILPGSSGEADHVKIELCEAYRQKREYHKGMSLLYGLLDRPMPLTDRNRAYAWNRLAALYNESENPAGSYRDSVFRYSRLCMELSARISDKNDLAASQNELSYQYIRRKEYDKALDLSRQSVSNFRAAGMTFHAMNALINLSNLYLVRKDYHAALGTLDEATRLSHLEENRNLYMRIYQQYASVNSATGNFREAYRFQLLCNILQGEFNKDRINNQILEQSARYDLFVKEQTIREEQKKNEFNHNQIILLIIISIALTLAFIFSLFYFRLKRKGALKQKLIDAVVETETSERRRIARDLHDGLGPVLSAINHYFQAFLDAKPEERTAIQQRLQMVISEAIDEVSRIAHNISPHVLEKYGLMTALNNLLTSLLTSAKYEISFISGFEERLDPRIELTVYRCITELVNNTLKHAEATRICLDIGRRDDKLLIRYSDNGIGFTASQGKHVGMGIHNITNRVETFGGTLSIASSPKAGTQVDITIPL